MGIQGLAKLLSDLAPRSLREVPLDSLRSRVIAVDASLALYSFMVATAGLDQAFATSSHLQGMFLRTLPMIENDIRPIFVFDGRPAGPAAGPKQPHSTARSARVTPEQIEDCKSLLRLMGMPVVQAPGEGEAQCAALVRAGRAYATATEDLDALTFGSPVVVRHLMFSRERGLALLEIDLARALADLKLSMDQFVDLCILCGCDYCDRIPGVGPQKAYKLIAEHGSLERVLDSLGPAAIPPHFPFAHVREVFKQPAIVDPASVELRWTLPNEAGLRALLVDRHGFDAGRVTEGVRKLKKARDGRVQTRLDRFFAPVPAPAPASGGVLP